MVTPVRFLIIHLAGPAKSGRVRTTIARLTQRPSTILTLAVNPNPSMKCDLRAVKFPGCGIYEVGAEDGKIRFWLSNPCHFETDEPCAWEVRR